MMSTAMFRSERGGSCAGMPRSQVKHTNKVLGVLIPLSVTSPVSRKCLPNGCLASQVRKPYTITKQRERWTDEEHELFLEALDKYGRAWRSIQGNTTRLAVKMQVALSFTSQIVYASVCFILQSTSELRLQCRYAVMLRNSSPN